KLLIDGEDAGQEAIEALIGLSFDTFVQTVLFAQGQPLFLDLQPRDMMALFVDVLDLNRWDARSKSAGDKVSALERVENKILQDIAAVEGALDEIEASQKDLKKKSTEWEQERATRQRQQERAQSEAEKRLEAIRIQHAQADLDYDQAGTSLKM